jgi:hypothetical protein
MISGRYDLELVINERLIHLPRIAGIRGDRWQLKVTSMGCRFED